jgi:hypothetical protein
VAFAAAGLFVASSVVFRPTSGFELDGSAVSWVQVVAISRQLVLGPARVGRYHAQRLIRARGDGAARRARRRDGAGVVVGRGN